MALLVIAVVSIIVGVLFIASVAGVDLLAWSDRIYSRLLSRHYRKLKAKELARWAKQLENGEEMK